MEETERTLRAIANAGISHVHWGHGWDGYHMYSPEEIASIARLLRKTNVKMKGIHGTNGWHYRGVEGQYKWFPQADDQISYTSFDETLRKQGEDLIRNRLELAAATDTREVVLHMQLPYVFFNDEDYKERYYAQAFRSLDAVKDYALAQGVRICVENLVGTPNVWQFEQFDRLFDRYPPEFLGFCCDTGHCILTDPTDPFCLPLRYAGRMYMIHLNDNHSFPYPGDFSDDVMMSQSDEHLVMGDGCVDFDRFAEILAASAYELPVVGEFKCGEPEEEFLKRCRERMEEFTRKVVQKRNSLGL